MCCEGGILASKYVYIDFAVQNWWLFSVLEILKANINLIQFVCSGSNLKIVIKLSKNRYLWFMIADMLTLYFEKEMY